MYHGKFLILNLVGVVKDEVLEVEEDEEEVKEILIQVEDNMYYLSYVKE